MGVADFVFFEEYRYRFWGRTQGGKGTIAAVEHRADGTWGERAIVLERDYHLSYPFVFRWQGRHYMSARNLGEPDGRAVRRGGVPLEMEFLQDADGGGCGDGLHTAPVARPLVDVHLSGKRRGS